MATTPKGIYYPNDYNEIADIPEDMKKMAESIDGVFEDTDSDLSDIKEEQTTQNNRLNSLEVDNTTNKSDILTNKQEINNIKTEQTEQNTNISTNATNIESLQEENDNLKKIVSQLPQVEGQGTSITLENTIEAPFTIFDVEGNSEQETTEGYNMLDLEKYSYSESSSALNGGTVTIKDGVITVDARNATGTTTALSVVKIAAADSIEAGTYYFGVDVYGAYESTPSTNIWQYRGNRTLTEKFIIKQWKYAVTQGNIGSTSILISNDTSKTTYEKYTNGASPNPDNEVPIKSAGDNIQLFDKSTAILNKYINNQGEEVASVGFYASDYISVIPNTNIILSGNTIFTPYVASKGAFYDENKSFISYVNIAIGDNIYTVPNNAKYYRTTVKPVDIDNIKVSKGNKATPWSPYGMGSINEKIQTKNFFDLNGEILYASNTNYIINNNQLKVPSSSGASGYLLYKKVYKSGTYHFSSKLLNGSSKRYVIKIFDKENNVVSDLTISGWSYNAYYKAYYKDSDGSFTIPSGYTFIVGFVYLDCTLGEIQIEPSSTATPYVPHEEQDYSIFVQQPFRSIGDVRDCFVKKSDGKLYERHYFNLTDLGDYNWLPVNQNENSRTQGLFMSWQLKNIENYSSSATTIPKLLSNKYISKPNYNFQSYGRNLQNYTISTYGGEFLYIQNSDFSGYTNEQVKEAMAGTILQYPRETPLDLPCTETQIQQLENKPSTYKDFTIIQSEDETPAYLEVSGIYDLNKLITRTEVLESEV